MSVDGGLISWAIAYDGLGELQRAGIDESYFQDQNRNVWRYINKVYREHGALPNEEMLFARFPDLELPKVRRKDLGLLIHNAISRKRYHQLMLALNEAAQVDDFERVDDAIQRLQGELNSIAYANGHHNSLVDIFSEEVSRRMMQEVSKRRRGQVAGIPTGLPRYDTLCGGLWKSRMAVIIGRSGQGKSWLDLFFCASAVTAGYKVILYPLEMSLDEIAFRVYTIFTQRMFGTSRALRNHDLALGHVNIKRMARFLDTLHSKFAGQLLVADVGSIEDAYTAERIEAEVEAHRPDMFWVDYLTLMKAPGGNRNESDWQAVRRLSNGIKAIAMRQKVVGGCSAQVNREAIRNRQGLFLPRLEHISYGDSIGQDADDVFSLAKTGNVLHWSLVKKRGGPEIGHTKMKFDPDVGVLEEWVDEDDANPED